MKKGINFEWSSKLIYTKIDKLNALSKNLLKNPQTKYFIICDKNTAKYCYPLIKDYVGIHHLIKIDAGEKVKNIQTVEYILEFLSKHKADKDSCIICLGGGMICDIGAFCASIYKRGISHILIPTSLLAMVDASYGAKTGINSKNGFKNIYGSFYPAHSIIICPAFLRTLAPRELISGYIESFKHGLINNKKHAEKSIQLASENKLPDLAFIKQSIQIKSEIVLTDPYEKGERKKLNLGHTLGHAIEQVSQNKKFALLHGEAIALGLLAEFYISNKLGLLSDEYLKKLVHQIRCVYPNLVSPSNNNQIIQACYHDKKNNEGKIKMALLQSQNKVKWDIPVDENTILYALQMIRLQ